MIKSIFLPLVEFSDEFFGGSSETTENDDLALICDSELFLTPEIFWSETFAMVSGVSVLATVVVSPLAEEAVVRVGFSVVVSLVVIAAVPVVDVTNVVDDVVVNTAVVVIKVGVETDVANVVTVSPITAAAAAMVFAVVVGSSKLGVEVLDADGRFPISELPFPSSVRFVRAKFSESFFQLEFADISYLS